TILMMSAAAVSEQDSTPRRGSHDGFIVKPFPIDQLLDALASTAGLTWVRRDEPDEARTGRTPPALQSRLADLEGLARLGLIRPLGDALEALRDDLPASLYQRLSHMLANVDLDGIAAMLEEMRDGCDTAT
ncbi:hypothetical protein WDZ92_50900, partial [Nostoc sp. NIES-2111]